MFEHRLCFPKAQEMTSFHWLDLLTARYRWFVRWPMLSELHVLRHTRKHTHAKGAPRGLPAHNAPLSAAVTSVSFLQATLTAGNMSKAEKQRSFMAVSFSRRSVEWRSVACWHQAHQRDIMGFKMKTNRFLNYSRKR